MRGIASRSAAGLLFAAAGVAAVIAAFLWGNHLLGLEAGLIYTALALALLWLLARSRMPAGRVSFVQVFVVFFALTVGYAMAFPASIIPDMQVFIDKQATDRQARAELAAVVASDLAYRDLSVSSRHLKIVNITVRGALGSRSDLDRLRSRIAVECPALDNCILNWAITLQDTGGRVYGFDGDLFREVEPGAAPDRSRM